jgi:hypothetical protein
MSAHNGRSVLHSGAQESPWSERRRRGRANGLAALTLLAVAVLAPAGPAQADSCSASASVILSRSTGGTCENALQPDQEFTITYRLTNRSSVDGGPNDDEPVESTIFSGSVLEAILAQEDSSVGSTQLPGVLTFVPVCPADSVGGILNPGDECDPNLNECGTAECGCETNQPGVVCAPDGVNGVVLELNDDLVFAPDEQKSLATIRVRVTGIVGPPAVCGLFFTRIDSAGDILVTTDDICDAQVTAGAQGSANLHAAQCLEDADCGDPECNVCVGVEEGENHCEVANIGSACGTDENETDCRAPACVDNQGVGECGQDQANENEGQTCDNNGGDPVEPDPCTELECVEGVCESGEPLDCNDDIPCTTDRCNDAGDACENVPDDSACDDEAFCNGEEVCDPMEGCQAGDAIVCNDEVECTEDECNEDTDECDSTPVDSNCSDSQFCNGSEICDVEEDCQPGTPPDCGDAFPCTTDSCNEDTDMCVHAPVNSVCADGEFCNGNEICNPSTGCVAGTPVPCGDELMCTTDSCNEATDMCEHDFSTCICGDSEQTGDEDCDPPAPAGSFEDCNNGLDDDGDGAIDCRDTGCKPNARAEICSENCELDEPCDVFIRDPARIMFNREGGPDEIYIHGRIPMSGDFQRVGRGVVFELSNPFGAIYRASLGPGDMRAAVAGRYFRFRDRDAELLGELSSRGGIDSVRFRTRRFGGEKFIVFTIRAYGDLKAANYFRMTTKLSAGPEVGYLTAEWTATSRGWVLHQKDFTSLE